MKRLPLILLLLMALCLTLPVLAEEERSDAADSVLQTADGAFPALNEAGFLDEGEFLFEDAENGVWRYCSTSLKVEILQKTSAKPKEVWYEAEIWTDGGEIFDVIATDPEKRMKSLSYPYMNARKHQTVFAITADFAHLRISKKTPSGVIIRDGVSLGNRTYPHNKKNVFPNLDTLALLPDGDMIVSYSNERTVEEYLEMGATDVLSFGPMMIRDGELNKAALKQYATSRQPRLAVGMFEKGHYLAVLVEGRNGKSSGCAVSWLADLMLERGCTLALNLDGGQSAGMIFMGKQLNLILNSHKKRASCRKSAEILGIGTSSLVASVDDPF